MKLSPHEILKGYKLLPNGLACYVGDAMLIWIENNEKTHKVLDDTFVQNGKWWFYSSYDRIAAQIYDDERIALVPSAYDRIKKQLEQAYNTIDV